MSRYYEESEIMKALDSNLVGTYYGLVLNVNIDEFLDGVPTADVVERKRGKWIEINDGLVKGYCSQCEWLSYYYENEIIGMNYCPNCGADMRGDEDGKVNTTTV